MLTQKEKDKREAEKIFIFDNIMEIKKFRRAHRGKCTSTSHVYPYTDFQRLMPELKKRFKTFNVEFMKTDVEVRIPM